MGVWDWQAVELAEKPSPDTPAKGAAQITLRNSAPLQLLTDGGGLRTNLRFALYRKGGRIALHAVNYNVCLLDPAKKVLEIEPTELRVPVPADWKAAQATCLDPDAKAATLPCAVADGSAHLTLPKTRIYKVVLLERK